MLHDSVLSFCIFRFSVRVTGPSAGKCSKHPAEISREITAEELREIKTPTTKPTTKKVYEGWR